MGWATAFCRRVGQDSSPATGVHADRKSTRLNSSHRDLHSFPTRRSSDLAGAQRAPAFFDRAWGGLPLSAVEWGRTPVLRLASTPAERVLEDPRRPGGLPHLLLSHTTRATLSMGKQ